MRETGWKRLFSVAIVVFAALSMLWTEGLPITIGQTTTGRPSFPAWRASLTPASQHGCFTVTYPSVVWQSARCVIPPSYPMPPLAPSTVGDGADDSAYSSSTLIGSSTGSFSDIVGLTSETDSAGSTNCVSTNGANCYSLQDNSNLFTTNTIYTGGKSSTGWEQFILSNAPSGSFIFIQYWLIGYSQPCPSTGPPSGSGWMYFAGGGGSAAGCYANSIATNVAYEAASNLGNLLLTGYANFNSNSNDAINFCVTGGTCYSISTTDAVLNLYQNWHYSEFNVFGYCCGTQANFNSGTSITVMNALDDQSQSAITPSCAATGYTAETNNLNLGSCFASSGQIAFTENNGSFATLTTSTSGQGSLSPNCPSPIGCQEPVGSLVTVSATAATDWQFSSWAVSGASCSGGSSSNPCQFTMPSSAVTVSASFTQIAFTLITKVDSGSGSVSPNCPGPSGCSENIGSPLTVTANANSGWAFSTWSTQTGISCSTNPCSFTMPDNAITLGASFIPTTTISLSLTPNSITVGASLTISGAISPNPGTVTVTISLSQNSGATWALLISTATDSSGDYSVSWTPPAPGSYELRASWAGDSQFAGSQSSSQSLSVTGSVSPTPTVFLSAPAVVGHGQTTTLSVIVFNPASSTLNANVTVQVIGPNSYVSFDVIQISVGAKTQATGYYDWVAPTQTGTYTVTISLLPSTPTGVDTETIQVN